MLQQEAPIVKRLPIASAVGLLASLAMAALGYTLQGQDGAVLAAVGCAGVFALLFQPTHVKTTARLYRVCGVVLRGDEETDQYFEEE